MPDLTELELEHIRQIIFLNENKYQKINIYLSQIQDIQVQQMFNNIAQEALNTKQLLTSFLNTYKFYIRKVEKMEEKTMINDIIKDLKFSINDYQNAICECENIGLRQTLQQIRNNEESLQYDLVKIANIKGYSNPSSKAETKEIENLKRQFQ